MAINTVKAGDSIGYGATYTCDKDKRVGVVSIGYGDGYPRAAVNGTPVLVKSGGQAFQTQLIGRVSMDMITIDLDPVPAAAIDDEVVLWGEGLCADIIARHSDTIAYELFCKVTARPVIHYQQTEGQPDGQD
jgi:alanine racemase